MRPWGWLGVATLVLCIAYFRQTHYDISKDHEQPEMVAASLRNVVVVGGSYVGLSAAQQLAAALPATHRVLLIEPHSHFHHLFAFPRFAVVPDHEHKAFIPYSHAFRQPNIPNPDLHQFIKAKVISVFPHHLELDREWQGTKRIDFDHLVLATGTKLPSPGSMQSDEKQESVGYFKTYQIGVKKADKIVIIGGGAVGVQMATDLKEVYPEKTVTLVQSRKTVMPRYHPRLHEIIKNRFDQLGVDLIIENRVVVPADGFPLDGSEFDVELKDGRKIPAQLVILATGQIANNQLLHCLDSTTEERLINPSNGFIRVRPTLQFKDPALGHMYALGDIADTGAHKAARPGIAQAGTITKNILSAIDGKEVADEIEIGPAGIHMSLGLTDNLVFRNPAKEGEEPVVIMRTDGSRDMNIEGVWSRRGVIVKGIEDYHL